jgi:prepilin-type N-terminal cleavage/methylation domain-containing protein
MSTRRGFSLVEILVTVVIIGVLAAILLPRYLQGAKTKDGKTGASPMQAAKGVDCSNNLSQLRMAYRMSVDSDPDNPPRSLTTLSGISKSMLACPVGKEPYQLDANGNIRCIHPGH